MTTETQRAAKIDRAQEKAALRRLLAMHAEFKAFDIYDADLDHDVGNLVREIEHSMDTLIAHWHCATVGGHGYILWEMVSTISTFMRAVSRFLDDGGEVREPDFKVLEMAIRCRPVVEGLCPEYVAWRAASANQTEDEPEAERRAAPAPAAVQDVDLSVPRGAPRTVLVIPGGHALQVRPVAAVCSVVDLDVGRRSGPALLSCA